MDSKQIDIEIRFRLLNAIQKLNTMKATVINLRPLTLLSSTQKHQTMYSVKLKIRLKDISLKHRMHIAIVVVLLKLYQLTDV